MTEEVPITEARKQLAELINRVLYGGERVLLTRHDRAVVALVSLEDYELLESLRRIDLTSTGPESRSGDAMPEPLRIAAELKPARPAAGPPRHRPGFRS